MASVLPSGQPSAAAHAMLGGPAAGVQAAGPLREQSLRREGDMASVLPSGQPWMSAAAHAMLGGPAAGVHAAGPLCERSLRPGGDMASVLASGRASTWAAALGGSTCDAGGVSCTANAAGDAVLSAPGGRRPDFLRKDGNGLTAHWNTEDGVALLLYNKK